ncbi:MAG: hypothetical protein KF681_17105 [Bdellovibrionaceae bacterium]|nr:hypothetical protein [Pseudobdellovibrionaceae bacterium]
MKFVSVLSSVLTSSLMFAGLAHANIRVSDGTVTISASGGDASTYGGSGGSAGDVNLNLAYADAEKTLITISGSVVRGGKASAFSEQVALKGLKVIQVYANGGDGAQGYWGSSGSDGRDGSSGSSGWSGHSGCPPGNGSDGSDGSDGTDGGDGGNGGNGGNGGRGGSVVISTSPDQNELMLFVRTSVSGGSGGAGGAGGSGGRGGRGGSGGSGGSGGMNTCRDAEGKPTNGPDGSRGRDGSNGRDGRSGSSGYSGSNGWGGSSGKRTFNLVSASGTQSYSALFDLQIVGATFIDDNSNLILEPGERVYMSSIQVANKGPMPSPAGQTIKFSFNGTSTLIAPAVLSVSLPPIAANSTTSLLMKKGELTLQVPAQSSLIGKKPVASGFLSINGVSLKYDVETGMAIGWPVSVAASSSRLSTAFDVAKNLTYTIKNVGAKDVGPKAQPLNVVVRWDSKTVPGSDVYLKFADGKVLSMERPLMTSDITVPAKGSAPLSFDLFVRGRKLLSSASGTLSVSVRLRDWTSGSEEVVQAIETPVALSLDMTQIEWNQTISLAGTKIQCQFAGLESPVQEIALIEIVKAKGTDKTQVRVAVPGSAPSAVSPVVTVSASRLAGAYQQFIENWTPANAVEFLNKQIAGNMPRGPWSFKGCEVRGQTVLPKP